MGGTQGDCVLEESLGESFTVKHCNTADCVAQFQCVLHSLVCVLAGSVDRLANVHTLPTRTRFILVHLSQHVLPFAE
jgi:hypothetical protein